MLYAGPKRLADTTQLQIRSDVLMEVEERVHRCVVCAKPPAPRGLRQMRRLAAWATERAERAERRGYKLSPSDEEDERCAVCWSQLLPVLGIPEHLLFPLLERLRGARRTAIRSFLERHFVFAMCRPCASDRSEKHVSFSDIEKRYRKTLKALNGTIRAPRGKAQVEDDFFFLLGDVIAERDERASDSTAER